jgi:anti-sigma B factor antagonist
MLAKLVMELTPAENMEAGAGKPAAARSQDGLDAAERTLLRRLTFDVTRTDPATVIALGGELDVVCADAFKRRFAEVTEDHPERVVLDIRELNFIDSIGLALLLRVNERSNDLGFGLWIVSAPNDPPRKIFRMTGTDAILPVVDEPPSF